VLFHIACLDPGRRPHLDRPAMSRPALVDRGTAHPLVQSANQQREKSPPNARTTDLFFVDLWPVNK